MKIEFQNSIAKLSFLCVITDIKIAWINPAKYIRSNAVSTTRRFFIQLFV